MTRYEQLTKTSIYQFTKRQIDVLDSLYPSEKQTIEREAFCVGSDWAHDWLKRNPMWHRWPDEKPERIDDYIVAFDNGNVFVAHYVMRTEHWCDIDLANNCANHKVIAWMKFPKAPNYNVMTD